MNLRTQRALEIASKLRRMPDGSIRYCATATPCDLNSSESIPRIESGREQFTSCDKKFAQTMGIAL